MNFPDFIVLLGEELKKPLPGLSYQMKMSSQRRFRELFDFSKILSPRNSSVLVLLYESGDSIRLVLIKRPDYIGTHGGQISLPGGRHEKTDHDLEATALRETQEEIGVPTDKIKVIGKLTELFIPPSNYLVQPFVGYFEGVPEFIPDPKEVERIIEISLNDLLDDNRVVMQKIKLPVGITFEAPGYDINGDIIWGATAMMLSEFKEIAGRIG